MSSSNISPNKKPVKLSDSSRKCTDRPNSPRKPKSRSKKTQPRSPKKPVNDTKQQKISNFFTVSPKRQLKNERTPVKTKTATSISDDLYLSPSERFDSLIPKVEDILRARENEEKFKKIHAIISESSKRFLEGLDNCKNDHVDDALLKKPSKMTAFKNCKHLSMKQITRKFKKDVNYIDDLFHGRVHNERYELFKNDTPLNNGTKNDLRVNETNIAFTQDQLIHIVSLFRERYDQGNMYKYSDFYFKVLLPEYCLKMFADVFKMTTADALNYLKSVPVQDFHFQFI